MVKNPLSPNERINLALDMMLAAKDLEPRFGTVWYMHHWCRLSFKIAAIRREVILSGSERVR